MTHSTSGRGAGRGSHGGQIPSSVGGGGSSSAGGRGNPYADHSNVDAASETGAGLDDFTTDLEEDTVVGPGRGPATTRQIPRNPDDRIEIDFSAKVFLDAHIVREITMTLKMLFHGSWCKWKEVPTEYRDLMFRRFQGQYRWDPSLDEQVRDAWTGTIHNRLGDLLWDARDSAIQRANNFDGEDYTVLKPYNPSWIKEAYWQDLIDRVWNTEPWKKISKTNKRNRMTLIDGVMSKHTGGSISTAQHRYKLQKLWGPPPTLLEVFERTHCRNRKPLPEGPPTDPPDYITPKVARVAETYDQLMHEKHGPDPNTHPRDDPELWGRSVGGWKKGRLFGFGTTQDPTFALTGESASRSIGKSYVTGPPPEVLELQEKLKKMEEDQRAREEERAEQDRERAA